MGSQEILLWNDSLGILLQISGHTPGGQRFSIDLTKWNRSHCWLNLVFSKHYQRKNRRKQIQSWSETGLTNQLKGVWNNFQYLKCKLTVTKKLGGGSNRSRVFPCSCLFSTFQKSYENSRLVHHFACHVYNLYQTGCKCCSQFLTDSSP